MLCSCSMRLTHNGIQSHRAFYLLIRPQGGCYRSWICKTCSTSNAQNNKMAPQTTARSDPTGGLHEDVVKLASALSQAIQSTHKLALHAAAEAAIAQLHPVRCLGRP